MAHAQVAQRKGNMPAVTTAARHMASMQLPNRLTWGAMTALLRALCASADKSGRP